MARAGHPAYPHAMNDKKLGFKSNNIGFVLGAVLAVALTEGVGNAGAQTVGITVTPPAPPAVVIVTPPAPVVVQDDYVYYPAYGVYFNSTRHQYAYLNGNAWVATPAPFGVSTEVLLASPSVRMDFHDSPEHHHAEMIQRYPKNWTSDSRQGHEDENHQDKDHQDRK
jgi:hypothetical protein